MSILRADSQQVKSLPVREVRSLLAEHIGNPARHAARAARAAYIKELFIATYNDGAAVVEREASDWYARLVELCGPHRDCEEIRRWFELESRRLLKLVDLSC